MYAYKAFQPLNDREVGFDILPTSNLTQTYVELGSAVPVNYSCFRRARNQLMIIYVCRDVSA